MHGEIIGAANKLLSDQRHFHERSVGVGIAPYRGVSPISIAHKHGPARIAALVDHVENDAELTKPGRLHGLHGVEDVCLQLNFVSLSKVMQGTSNSHFGVLLCWPLLPVWHWMHRFPCAPQADWGRQFFV